MTVQHAPDLDLDAVAEHCYSAVFSDVCDQFGRRHQTTRPGLRRFSGAGTLVGWARTFRSVAVDAPPDRHYGGEIDFIDSLRPGEVVVGECRPEVAAWGELFSTASRGRGARGAVIAGMVRDTAKIHDLGFPLFALGTRPTDALGRISLTHADEQVECMGVPVSAGDLVVADDDGVAFVPRPIAVEAAARALKKATTEDQARDLLLEGAKLADVWERFGVL